MPTALITHSDFLTHDTGPFHPERADRLRSIQTRLGISGNKNTEQPIAGLKYLNPRLANDSHILAVHKASYVEAIPGWCKDGYTKLPTGDTVISPNSEMVARLAAGAVVRGVDAVLSKKYDNAFCAIRPPGHHAESNRGMGFCIYNNAAIAARYAQSNYNIERIAILDWDIHHGNGTQEIFEEDPSVYYFSIHQSPLYPFTGAKSDRGSKKGKGYTLNVPVSAGSGDEVFIETLNNLILPNMRIFKPDLLILSAGFDAHVDDPLSGTLVTDQGFQTMSKIVLDFSKNQCNGQIVSILEGGYNLEALSRCVTDHVGIMAS